MYFITIKTKGGFYTGKKELLKIDFDTVLPKNKT